MHINRSGYYKWVNRIVGKKLSDTRIKQLKAMKLFSEYHNKYPSHGYKWLNKMISNDNIEFTCSDTFAHKICKYLGIKSKSKHERHKYRRARSDGKNYNNLILNKISPINPFEVVVSDMTAFKLSGKYYELTLYMDLFNNEIVSYGLSDRRGDPKTYYDGLLDLVEKKENYKNFVTVLHTDHGSVYSSKNYNLILDTNNFIHSMSAPGTPTENGAMEAINGWVKEELLNDFKLTNTDNVKKEIEDYIYYFNYKRPAAALNYLTPMQYKELHKNS